MKLIIYLFFSYMITISTVFTSCKANKDHEVGHAYLEDTTYINPVIKGFYPDPSICRKNNDYYLVTSSFEYFPGVPVFHSTDLVNWEQVGYALTRKSQLNLDDVSTSGGIWAPAIRYHKGVFYLITTVMHAGKNFIVTAENPAGPWSEPVNIDIQCIDPSLFFDDDGKVYFTGNTPWDGRPTGIYQAEIDITTGELLTDYKKIWDGTGGRHPEGPHLYKINDYYYLMIAEGGTEAGHMETIARSKSPWGPFEECPHNPVLSNRDEAHNNVQNTGHGDLIEGPGGKWWMVHLAVRSVGRYHHLGRETFLAAVDWDEDGWPVVNQNGTSSIHMHPVPPAPQITKDLNRNFQFEDTVLPLDFNYIRNPHSYMYSLTSREGYLALSPSQISLDSLGSPTFIGVRQRDFNVEATTRLLFNPDEGSEAGMVAFMNNEHYYSISLSAENGQYFMMASMKMGKVKHHSQKVPVSSNEIWLKISGDKYMYRLYFSQDGDTWEIVAENSTRYLSSEVAGGFTGTYLGLFAAKVNKSGGAKAYFDYLDILYK